MEITVTKEDFENEVLNSDIPVLVDFYADWCGPCQRQAPIVGEIASEYEGKIKVAKINVDNDTELAIKYKALTIPTLLFFKNGEVTGKLLGLSSKEEITELF